MFLNMQISSWTRLGEVYKIGALYQLTCERSKGLLTDTERTKLLLTQK